MLQFLRYHSGLHEYQYHFEVHFRYHILEVYRQYGTIILVLFRPLCHRVYKVVQVEDFHHPQYCGHVTTSLYVPRFFHTVIRLYSGLTKVNLEGTLREQHRQEVERTQVQTYRPGVCELHLQIKQTNSPYSTTSILSPERCTPNKLSESLRLEEKASISGEMTTGI